MTDPESPEAGDWPTSEPEIGWEQFARNWQDTARLYAQNADYWRERAESPTPEGRELEDLLARADWLLNSTVGERIAAGVNVEDMVRDLASALRHQRDEIDVLQDDVLRFITQRNLRRGLIQEVSEDAWDDVDGWQEMAAKGAMVVAERDRLKRELAEARDTRPQLCDATVAHVNAATDGDDARIVLYATITGEIPKAGDEVVMLRATAEDRP